MTEDELRDHVGRLVRQLVREDDSGAEKITDSLQAHLGDRAVDLPVLRRSSSHGSCRICSLPSTR